MVSVETRIARVHPAVSSFGRPGKIGRVVRIQLPFSKYARGVPGPPHAMADRHRVGRHQTESDPIAMVVQTGHQLHPSGGTQRLCVRVGKPNPTRGHAVDVRGPVRRAAVTSEPLDADVVGHDQNHIGRTGRVRLAALDGVVFRERRMRLFNDSVAGVSVEPVNGQCFATGECVIGRVLPLL